MSGSLGGQSALRIGVRLPARTSGGGKVFGTRLVEALAHENKISRVTVFVQTDSEVAVPANVSVVRMPSRRFKSEWSSGGDEPSRRRGQGLGIDALLCFGIGLTRVPNVASLYWPLTVAPFEQQTMRALGGGPLGCVRSLAMRAVIGSSCRRADGIVFSSYYARAAHLAAYPSVRHHDTTVIYPAPSLTDDAEPDAVIEQVPAEPYILFVSHLYPYKMVVELIRGFSRWALHTRSAHRLVVAGAKVDPDYANRIERAVVDSGVADRILLLGEVAEASLKDLYRGAQAFVFPSLSENAGSYALIDAFARGLPVVASGTSSMPEICQSAAYYVDPRDEASIAAGLDAVLGDATLRGELAQRSRSRADALPTWQDIARLFATFADDVVRRRRS